MVNLISKDEVQNNGELTVNKEVMSQWLTVKVMTLDHKLIM